MNLNLSPKQLAFSVGYGVALWIGAAFLVRTMGPMGALSGWGLVISYLVLIPGTVPAVLFTKQVVGPFRDNLLMSVSIISATALLLDGVTVGFFPTAYGTNAAHQVAAAGFFLWGGGIGLVLALVMGKDR
jgi:hypothetical protein